MPDTTEKPSGGLGAVMRDVRIAKRIVKLLESSRTHDWHWILDKVRDEMEATDLAGGKS